MADEKFEYAERSSGNNGRYEFILQQLHRFDLYGMKELIDCASGNGAGGRLFMADGFNVTCVDNDAATVEKLQGEHINAVRANIIELPFPTDRFDIFISSETLEHLEKKETGQAVKEIRRVTKKGGIICITVPENKKICLENPFHKQYLSGFRLRLLFLLPVIFTGVYCKVKDRCNRVIFFKNG